MSALAITFWICVLLLVHAYAGYPCWLWLRARVAPRRVRRRPQTPRVAVVMAVHDGAQLIEAKLRSIFASDYPRDRLAVVVACDGCSDDTVAVIERFGDARVTALDLKSRRGKANGINAAVAAAGAVDILVMTDVRQRLDGLAIRELVATLGDPQVGAAGGELCFEAGTSGFARGIDAYWRYEKAIRQWESASGSVVGVSGALYAMHRVLYEPLPAGTVLDDVLVPMRIVRGGKRVVFEPAAIAWDRPSEHPAQERTRKLRTLAGNFQLLQLAPWLANPRANPLWGRFACHKLLRLLAPWLLLLLLPLSAMLAPVHVVYRLALMGYVVALALLLCARAVPMLARSLPVRILIAFCHLNVFAAQALFVFARNRRLHLW